MASIEVRKKKAGKTTYRAKIRLKGSPAISATFDRLTDAKRWIQSTEAAIREGRYSTNLESRKRTFGEMIDRYIQEVLPTKPRGERDQLMQLEWWKTKLGDYTVAQVTPSVIVEMRNLLGQEPGKRGRNRGSATINRYLAALGHVFTIAVKEWEWIDNNPMRRVGKLREPRGRVRFLRGEVNAEPSIGSILSERDRLLSACRESNNPDLYPAVVLSLSTGARKSEIMNLRWPDIDFQRGTITLHKTKNGDRRAIPLVGLAFDLVLERNNETLDEGGLVFPSSRNPEKPIDLRAPWEAALKKANIEDFRWHDLRHSAASYLAMNGASLAEIAEVLGHKTLQMVKRYAHLSDQHTMSVVKSMNDRIFQNQRDSYMS